MITVSYSDTVSVRNGPADDGYPVIIRITVYSDYGFIRTRDSGYGFIRITVFYSV